MRFDTILQYSMEEIDIKAYKICVYWEDIVDHECPNYRTSRITKGDPRKCHLFKCARKLVLETQGLLPENMYKYYVYSQIATLKAFSDGRVHALIEPPCLYGDTAWLRWKIWKNKFDKIKNKLEHENSNESNKIQQINSSVIADLKKTFEFLKTKIQISPESIKRSLTDNTLQKWVLFNKVSPYFIILSSIVKNSVSDLHNYFGFEPDIYQKSIDDNVKNQFNQIFGSL
jgi:hypothetical protein